MQTQLELDAIHTGLAERMVGVDQGVVVEQSLQRAHVLLVGQNLVPLYSLSQADASQWHTMRVPFEVDVCKPVEARSALDAAFCEARRGRSRIERHPEQPRVGGKARSGGGRGKKRQAYRSGRVLAAEDNGINGPRDAFFDCPNQDCHNTRSACFWQVPVTRERPLVTSGSWLSVMLEDARVVVKLAGILRRAE